VQELEDWLELVIRKLKRRYAAVLRRVGMMRRYLLRGVSLMSALIGGAPEDTLAQPPQGGPVVRLAELQIDPARLDEYVRDVCRSGGV